jgi:hypothetical protein
MALLVTELLVVLLWPLLLLQLWLNICHGTGINFPAAVAPAALLGVPIVLERLEGTVSRPEVDVFVAAPADESDRMANSMRPDCGSTIRSRMWPKVLPS